MAEAHVAPPVWVDAYNDFVSKADGPSPPDMIALPAVQLPPALVREILRLFDPDGDF
jgi:hypothetical protein